MTRQASCTKRRKWGRIRPDRVYWHSGKLAAGCYGSIGVMRAAKDPFIRLLRHSRLGTILVAAAGRHESAFGNNRSAGLSYRWLRSSSGSAVVCCKSKERSPAQRYSGGIQSFADPAPRWSTHSGGRRSFIINEPNARHSNRRAMISSSKASGG
jgi:hypothetical protein